MTDRLATARIFTVLKAGNDDRENEDAAAVVVGDRGLTAAVADGATDAIFSREWALALSGAAAESPVGDFAAIVQAATERWKDSIPPAETLPWFAQARLPEGSAATLLRLEVRSHRGVWYWQAGA